MSNTKARQGQPSEIELNRRAFRKSRKQKSTLVAVLSTIGFAIVAWLSLVNTPGWDRVQQSFFDYDTAVKALPHVLDGLLLNLRVLFFSAIGVLVFGLALALLRTLRAPIFTPIRLLVRGYVDLFRGLPLIIVLYLVGFGIPGLRLEFLGRIPAEVLGTTALILTYSAYVAEVFRAGIEAVHPSQRLAARSLGLTYAQSMRLVVLPQAFRKVAPPLMNDFVSLQKDVGLISVLGAVDAVRGAQIEVAHFANFTPYVIAGLLFVLLAIPTVRLADYVTGRLAKREQAGGVL
jgi:polar amino acid transport system permease protein